MKARKIKQGIYWMGSVDWDSRLFDALVPLPDGTSYNAYLIEGSEKTALIDTVDPPMAQEFMASLRVLKKSITLSQAMRNRTIPEPLCRFLPNTQKQTSYPPPRPKGCSWTI
jgi:hypothetical protein